MKRKNQKRLEAIERLNESISMDLRTIEHIKSLEVNRYNTQENKNLRIANIQDSIQRKEITIIHTRAKLGYLV